jgi:hypothetical protein
MLDLFPIEIFPTSTTEEYLVVIRIALLNIPISTIFLLQKDHWVFAKATEN